MYCVCMLTDYIIRFGTMAVKALVVTMFLRIFPTKKKGKYYMLLEYISQFYRTIVPAPMWVRYLSNPLMSGAVFAVLITSVYLMLKGGLIFASLRELYRAFVMFLQDQVSLPLMLRRHHGRPQINIEGEQQPVHTCTVRISYIISGGVVLG